MKFYKIDCRVIHPDGIEQVGDVTTNDWTMSCLIACEIVTAFVKGGVTDIANVRFSHDGLKVDISAPEVLPRDVSLDVYCEVVGNMFCDAVNEIVESME